MNVIAKDVQAHWRVVQPLFSIRDENEYDKAIATLNTLIDEVGTNNTPFMSSLIRSVQLYMLMRRNIIRSLNVVVLKPLNS